MKKKKEETTRSEITRAARSHPVLRRFYRCCFGVGEYPRAFEPNSVYFLNTSGRRESRVYGHWVALHSSRDGFLTYFDSAGLPPRDPLAVRLDERVYVYNKDLLQHPEATSCGRWCLLFGVLLARGKSLTAIKDAYFTRDLLRNEKVLVQLYAREFR
jgi:hypothetical protein